MAISLKATKLFLLNVAVLLVLDRLITMPVWLLLLSSLLISLVLEFATIKINNRKKLSAIPKWIEQFDGRITFNQYGLFISKLPDESSIAWNDLVRVELIWEENLFGDPQFGRYCDTYWLLRPNSGLALTISESVNESNSKILLEAFRKCLPNFNFNYVQFNESHKNRIFELKGGKVTVWERNA